MDLSVEGLVVATNRECPAIVPYLHVRAKGRRVHEDLDVERVGYDLGRVGITWDCQSVNRGLRSIRIPLTPFQAAETGFKPV